MAFDAVLVRHPVHETVHGVHGVVRIADGARPRFAQVYDALRAAARQAIAIIGHARERIKTDSLRGDVDVFHRIVERIDTHHVCDFIDRMKIDGLILITPWDTLKSVAKDHFPWLPVGLFLRDKYDTVDNLKTFPGGIFVAGAELDDIIPIRHAERLFESLPGRKKMVTIKKAGHNDWPDAVDRAWWREIMAFFDGTEPQTGALQ